MELLWHACPCAASQAPSQCKKIPPLPVGHGHEHDDVLTDVSKCCRSVEGVCGPPKYQSVPGRGRGTRACPPPLPPCVQVVLFTTSGYLACLFVLSELPKKDDFIVHDEHIHKSCFSGAKLSGASLRRFAHNDFRRARALVQAIRAAHPNPQRVRVFLVMEGVYSMQGTVGDLPAARALADEFGCVLVCDDSHGFGVLGPSGAGLEDHFGMPGAVDIVCGSLSKGLSCKGGCIGLSRCHAGVFLTGGYAFSTAVPVGDAWMALQRVRYVQRRPELLRSLRRKVAFMRAELRGAGFAEVDPQSPSPVIPLVFRFPSDFIKMGAVQREMEVEGFFVALIALVAVRRAEPIFRVCVQDWMDEACMRRFVGALARACARHMGGYGGVRRVLGVSLGASARDHRQCVALGGLRVFVERFGTNGDAALYDALVAQARADPKVDAVGLGGVSLRLRIGRRALRVSNAARLLPSLRAPAAGLAPCVDGTVVQECLEPRLAGWIRGQAWGAGARRVFFTCGAARWTMVEGFLDGGYDVSFGDLAFELGLPVVLRSARVVQLLAVAVATLLTSWAVPYSWVYSGPRDTPDAGGPAPKVARAVAAAIAAADLVVGEHAYVVGRVPLALLRGKIVVTNSVTAAEAAQFMAAGVRALVTSTPELGGRRFGTNVVEALLLTYARARSGGTRGGGGVSQTEIAAAVQELDLQPSVELPRPERGPERCRSPSRDPSLPPTLNHRQRPRDAAPDHTA